MNRAVRVLFLAILNISLIVAHSPKRTAFAQTTAGPVEVRISGAVTTPVVLMLADRHAAQEIVRC